MELIYQHWQYMWLFPHMFGFYHMCVVISTHNTVTISVVFTKEVCVFAHTCGNNHICVEKPNKQVLGFSHTGVEKHTQGLISPWANGALSLLLKPDCLWFYYNLLVPNFHPFPVYKKCAVSCNSCFQLKAHWFWIVGTEIESESQNRFSRPRKFGPPQKSITWKRSRMNEVLNKSK